MIKFITGNHNKFKEMNVFVSELEMIDIELPEIQEIDPRLIIEAKLLEARKQVDGDIIVEDTSLVVEGMKGLPGPLIKWFTKTIGEKGLYELAASNGATKATASVVIGFIDDGNKVSYFEGSVSGELVAPRGSNGFSWDMIFQPEGFDETFAEMTQEQKDNFSMRAIAARKLEDFLNS